jgi:hypothetical protein
VFFCGEFGEGISVSSFANMFEYARLARQMLQSGPFNSTSVTEAMVNQGTFLQGGGACLPPPQVLLPLPS